MATPRATDQRTRAAASVLTGRLRQCWEGTFEWDLLPRGLGEVGSGCMVILCSYVILKMCESFLY